ncbi:hypothetical protein INR49_016955 [Caranx melampygus]|nr:hypothetical protein INR49_016955 [Caranx melampygus]
MHVQYKHVSLFDFTSVEYSCKWQCCHSRKKGFALNDAAAVNKDAVASKRRSNFVAAAAAAVAARESGRLSVEHLALSSVPTLPHPTSTLGTTRMDVTLSFIRQLFNQTFVFCFVLFFLRDSVLQILRVFSHSFNNLKTFDFRWSEPCWSVCLPSSPAHLSVSQHYLKLLSSPLSSPPSPLFPRPPLLHVSKCSSSFLLPY